MAKPKTAGGRGYVYEARFCMWCFVRGFTRDIKNFKLEYQETTAGKFDDVIFHENGKNYEFMQLKHKEMKNKDMKLTHAYFFNENINGDYNLLKYVKAFVETNSNPRFKDKIKSAIVFTNIEFDLKDGRLDLIKNKRPWYNDLEKLQVVECFLDNESILSFNDSVPKRKYYKFANNEDLFQILCRQAIDTAQKIRQKHQKDKKKINKEEVNFAIFCENFPQKENEIRVALDHIIYAVGQPNDEELKKLIGNEIKDKFKLHDVEDLYNKFETTFTHWCNNKDGPFPEIISYKDAEMFFNMDFKSIWFDVRLPTKAFTGRHDELKQIKEKLEERGDFVVSQTVSISGLGGIGKTETVRRFINDFQDDFYRRVIWISAENDASVEESFRRLGEKLKIEKVKEKYAKTIIDEVFDYFYGFKVLFVFDNYDKKDDSENYVSYCREYVSHKNKKSRPYFLFTSRDKNCLPGVSSIDLGVLPEEQAVEMIKNQLTGTKIKYDQNVAENLAETLQYFPLALRQATAYIKEESSFLEDYEMADYLRELNVKRKEFLDHKFFDEFGNELKDTTLITWNITFDKIQNCKESKMCVKIMKLLAFLYADKIDVSMFINYFKDERGVLKAVQSLERYCLITKIKENGEDFYQIHRLVQTVLQINFDSVQNQIIEESIRLVASEAFEQIKSMTLEEPFNLTDKKNLDTLNKCNFENAIHANNILTYVKTKPEVYKKFGQLLEHIQQRSLLNVVFSNDVNKILKFDVSRKELAEFMLENMEELCKRKCDNVIRTLLKFDDKSSDGKTVLHYAVIYQNIEEFQYFIDKHDIIDETILLEAVERDRIEFVQILLQKHFKRDHKFADGQTVIDVAVQNVSTNCILYLESELTKNMKFKPIMFDVRAPTKSFTGLDKELKLIRNGIEKERDLVLSQTVAFSGLGGIGKTETARQFINDYKSHFYGRVIWINAENDAIVDDSFRRLGKKLKIEKLKEKYAKTIIDEVFDYFNGLRLRVLFVFDNYEKKVCPLNESFGLFIKFFSDESENYVSHCRKYVSQQNKKSRPYFLFISRDRNCLPGVSSIDLGVLSEEQAIKIIKKQLTGTKLKVKVKYDKKNAENLAKALQYFPIPLRQATAYIKEESSFLEDYEMADYLRELNVKRKEFLDHKFFDEFGNELKDTTLITWNISFDKIQYQEEGDLCVKIMKLLAYLHADEIDVYMFIDYFKDTRGVFKAMQSLERYCLITKIEEKGREGRDFYQIHRLVQTVVQEKFSSEQNEIIEESIRLVASEAFEQFTSWRFRIKKFLHLNDQKYLDSIKKCKRNAIHANYILTYVKAKPEIYKKFGRFLKIFNKEVYRIRY